MRLSGVAEVDAEGVAAEEKAEQGEAGLSCQRIEQSAAGHALQMSCDEAVPAMCGQQIHRKDDERSDHQQGLYESVQQTARKPPQNRVEQHDDRTHQDADAIAPLARRGGSAAVVCAPVGCASTTTAAVGAVRISSNSTPKAFPAAAIWAAT